MPDRSRIEWTDATWNPVTGCSPVSAGCDNCYAEKMHRRFYRGWNPRAHFDVRFHPDRLDQPLRWKKPRRIFVCSMGDLFHDGVREEWILSVLIRIIKAPQHTFMVLTKRPSRMNQFFAHAAEMTGGNPPNLWLGVTAENQEMFDLRWPYLRDTPAALRFISFEPGIGPLWIPPNGILHADYPWPDWVIAGCESGPRRRPAKIEWFRSLRDQCVAAGVPFFLKQMEVNGKVVKMPMLDGREWKEFPK